MGHRYELSDQQWKRLEPLLPPPRHHGGRGRPSKDHRRGVNGLLWRLHTGAPWRDIPERYGPWRSVYSRFRRWRRDGTWAQILTQLLEQREHQGRLGHSLWFVDATIVRASRAAGGAKKKSGGGSELGRAQTGATQGAS